MGRSPMTSFGGVAMATARDMHNALRRHGFEPADGEIVPGISDTEVRKLVESLEVDLPEDFCDFYQYSAAPFRDWIDRSGTCMPPLFVYSCNPWRWEEVLPEWRFAREMEALIRSDVEAFGEPWSMPEDIIQRCPFHPGWIPLGHDNTRCQVLLDMAPGPSGRAGQVFWISGDDFTKKLLASSLADYLERLIACLDQGLICANDGGWHSVRTGGAVADFDLLSRAL